MRTGLHALLLLLLACLVLGAGGCGGGGDEPAGDAPAAETATPQATAEETATPEEAPEADATTEPSEEDLEAAVESCKRSVESQPQLSDDSKQELRNLCEKAAKDPKAARQAARDVCRRIVGDTLMKGQPGRQEALEACDRAER